MTKFACVTTLQAKTAALRKRFLAGALSAWLGKSRSYWSGLLIAVLLASSGCSTVLPPPAVVTEIIELPDPTPPIPYPQPLTLETFKWTVMAPGHWRDPDEVYFCLAPTEYEAAARNNGQLLRFTKEVMWQLRYYNQEPTADGMGRVDESADQ